MIRSALRAVGYIVSELIPAQAIRCVLDRDYADAMYTAAAKHDGAEQLNEREAEEEVWEPHEANGDCCTFHDPTGLDGVDFDDDPMVSDSYLRYNEDSIRSLREVFWCRDHNGIVRDCPTDCDTRRKHMLDEPPLSPDELVAVRQLIEPLTGPTPLSEALARTESNEVGDEPEFNAAERTVLRGLMRVYAALPVGFHQRHTKPPAASAEAAGSPEAVSAHSPVAPASGHLTVDWLTPAICEVLAQHHLTYSTDESYVWCQNVHHRTCARLADEQEWREHVARPLAVHILKALAAQPK